MARKKRKNKAKSVEDLAQNIPEVKLEGKVNFYSEITISDFEKFNAGEQAKPEIDEEMAKRKKDMEEVTSGLIKAQKYTDISAVNIEMLEDIENGNAEKYFTSETLNRSENNSDLTELLHNLADQNNANAQNILGVCYISGTNVAIDEKIAVEYLTKASEQEHTAAQRNLAITLENQNSPDKNRIITLYEKAAEKDDAYALNNLAACYLVGDGVKQNVKQAVKYFEKAVKLGDDYAMLNLADCYSVGNGVHKNDKKAFELYKQAADKGNVDGMRIAADCLLNGIGTKQDFQTALEMYKKAADFGDTKAMEKYNELSEKLNPQKHSELKIGDEVQKTENKKSSLSKSLDLAKKVEENKENGNNEKTEENKEITPHQKKKEDVSL